MGDILKLTMVLLIVSFVAGLAIAITNQQTYAKIEEQKALAQQEALAQVFPEGTDISEETKESLPAPYWIGKKDGQVIGYAFKGEGAGYSGSIKFIVGIDENGSILGLSVLSQTETPGLGDRVQEVVSKKYIWNGLLGEKEKDSPWFTKQFKRIDVTKDIGIDKSKEWHVMSDQEKQTLLEDNNVSCLTGATISTRAVTKGIKKFAYTYLSALQETE